jgi:hypothetical protein
MSRLSISCRPAWLIYAESMFTKSDFGIQHFKLSDDFNSVYISQIKVLYYMQLKSEHIDCLKAVQHARELGGSSRSLVGAPLCHLTGWAEKDCENSQSG